MAARALLLASVIALTGCVARHEQFEARLRPLDGKFWALTFIAPRPVRSIAMVRVPDDSRVSRWQTVSPDIELVHDSGRDLIRHRDGRTFTSAQFRIAATYVPLPKEYAPFSPFTDGGLLIHSGRFHACPDPPPGETCEGPWFFRLTPPSGASLTVPGWKGRGERAFASSDDGFMMYVGNADPVTTEYFLGIVDPGLPAPTRALMQSVLPRLMAWFARRLPAPKARPELYMSYDPGYANGFGRQGGTLPGQVFMHFYGRAPAQSDLAPTASEDVTWFFAHEVGHVFQRQVFGRREDAWIHEGAAEAFAYLASRDMALAPSGYLQARLESARSGCAESLAAGSLSTASARGDFAAHYSCGFLMAMAIHEHIISRGLDANGLFALWSSLLGSDQDMRDLSSAQMLAKLRQWSEPPLIDILATLIDERLEAPQSFLMQLLPEEISGP